MNQMPHVCKCGHEWEKEWARVSLTCRPPNAAEKA